MKIVNSKAVGRIFLIILILSSCSDNAKQRKINHWYKYINESYAVNKRNFNSKYIDHFPNDLYDIDDIRRTVIGTKPGLDCVTFMQGASYINSRFDSIATIFLKNNVEHYSSKDSVFLIYNRYVNKDNEGFKTRLSIKEKAELKQASDQGRLPIPNFYSYLESETFTEYNLPNDFSVFVIEAKSGRFEDETYLTKGDLMPDKWKHGFSRGVALSKERLEIIYWFIIW